MRTKKGTIVSTKMEKTIVVRVDSYKVHPKYRKQYKVSKKFYAHVEDEKQFEEGQVVTIAESNPVSKTKRWSVVTEEEKQAGAA